MSSIFGMNSVEFSDGNYWSVKTQLMYMCKFRPDVSSGYPNEIRRRGFRNRLLIICEQVSISVGVVALTLFFSLCGFSRAAIYYMYKRGITIFAIRTGMYRKSLDHPKVSSKHLVNRAIEVTEKLKKVEADVRRKAKREKRAAEELEKKRKDQSQALGEGSPEAATATCGEGQAMMRTPRVFPRPSFRRTRSHYNGPTNAQDDVEMGAIRE